MKAITVHGFNVKNKGVTTVGRLEPGLRKYGFSVDSDEGDYGYFGLLDIRMRNGDKRRKVLYRLAKAFESVDLIITHSNGGHFTNTAMRMLPEEFEKKIVVVNISPAMNRKTEPALATKAELNLCTKHDGWVKASSYIPFMKWGRRGAWGYSGDSAIVYNEFHNEVDGHSDWFLMDHRSKTLRSIVDFWETHK